MPRGVLAEVVTVRVEEPDPFTEVGTKDGVAPEGRPLADKLTVPEIHVVKMSKNNDNGMR